jgi:hypothetical protein
MMRGPINIRKNIVLYGMLVLKIGNCGVAHSLVCEMAYII